MRQDQDVCDGRYGKQIEGLTPRALIVLERYGWPGNVRELEHIIGRACILTEASRIDVPDLPSHLTESTAQIGSPDDLL
jgi:DNA-binding NtrC family response regulator